ncbi:MAG: hypothetical protein M1817_001324 [Caeruleum heppii]|nr:MAG: hypothetical protein M1817_001324 [Caeruleum heppii]
MEIPILVSDPATIPPELQTALAQPTNVDFLDALAAAALKPHLTALVFSQFESIFVDIAGRLIRSAHGSDEKTAGAIAALARLLPCAPHLAVYLDRLLSPQHLLSAAQDRTPNAWSYITSQFELDLKHVASSQLQDALLAIIRLLHFDNEAYASHIRPARIQSLLLHRDQALRYLAIRVLCLYLHASDAFLQSMLAKHIASGQMDGICDGKVIDLYCLTLYEETRIERLAQELQSKRLSTSTTPTLGNGIRSISSTDLCSHTVDYAGVLLPRVEPDIEAPTSVIKTSTTIRNQQCLAKAALSTDPILVTGLPGSGKTLLIEDLARALGTGGSMVKLHLNEQTDAKMLVGTYTADATPGTFSWKAGVLTQAVRQGFWVLIEDLDRAPREVVSVILPLLERRELLIPSRGENVFAARGFRLFATIRTSRNIRGEEVRPAHNQLGGRLWTHVSIDAPGSEEQYEIIEHTFPPLSAFLPMMMSVFNRLLPTSGDVNAGQSRSLLGRPLTFRDLMRWCRRVHMMLVAARVKDGSTGIPETVHHAIFAEAADCFTAHVASVGLRADLVRRIGEEMHVAPQQVDHFLQAHHPKYSITEKLLSIGRATLSRQQVPIRGKGHGIHNNRQPFASTRHTLRLLERVGMAVKMSEPVLLVGETATGKTTAVQQLADLLGQKLTVVNLSQQSESGDLLGGFKPISIRSLAVPIKDAFDELFEATFSSKKNLRYLDMLGKCVAKGQWSRAVKMWDEALKMVEARIGSLEISDAQLDRKGMAETRHAQKKRKVEPSRKDQLRQRWQNFASEVQLLRAQISDDSRSFAFKFVEGNIVKAVRNGEWVLLDEINLASPDTLEHIADLLSDGASGSPSLLLSETGNTERIKAHANFRVFGAMNPATDIGKRDLAQGLRSRFTEIYVESPDRDLHDLTTLIQVYLRKLQPADERLVHDVAQLYLEVRRLAEDNQLVDGAGQKPHFSLRTLTRTMTYAIDIAPVYGLRRSLYEGFLMSFSTLLDSPSELLVLPLIDRHLLGTQKNARSLLRQMPRSPTDGNEYVQFEHYWMRKGHHPIQSQPQYIITPFVRRNLLNLVRATSTRRFPILLQGPTSSGKTSMIDHLAKLSGHHLVRINNHEHTDLQEYLGTYVSGDDGKLRFQEGVLVQALREGSWVVLDELNLAPTDVLEALNRLLDDNRELLIPETQEVVRPHKHFMLFATQNPPGMYGGRKILSRAFRNRFLELHFDDIPEAQLETILRERSRIAPSYCTQIVKVYKELSLLRQTNRLFEQRNSFATLRDLFRWALRKADNRQQLAENGFMLLAERVRRPEDQVVVRQAIEKVMRVTIDEEQLYAAGNGSALQRVMARENSRGIIWTKAMRRLFTLAGKAIENNEPVLLVGDTGCGKTTVCQLMAEELGKQLYMVNAHQNTEAGDLIGAQRPLRSRSAIERELLQDLTALFSEHLAEPLEIPSDMAEMLDAFGALDATQLHSVDAKLLGRIRSNVAKSRALFEWADGPLVQAMLHGQFFLLDEISLADDSVLERMNSVLEPARTILLAEKGPKDAAVKATGDFQFFATMNPGGDYGKRELSPALRNRFTEVWVPPVTDIEDVLEIVRAQLRGRGRGLAETVVAFAQWFQATYGSSSNPSLSIRDLSAWAQFINVSPIGDPGLAMVHGAAMIYIDTLGANPSAMFDIAAGGLVDARQKCLERLTELLNQHISHHYFTDVEIVRTSTELRVGHFSLRLHDDVAEDPTFILRAPTTKLNAMRIARAMTVRKPVLLEGNPGVGKTTLVAALARAVGKPLTRINLSDQTDLMDLFGSDVPVEGAEAGQFAWRDAPFLQAMQNGHWVLLDEMNLAPQAILEGLNACLDHRGQVYVPELDQTFSQHPDFAVFAAQNPHHQGGGRKGLPASFVNRFNVVYADTFTDEDLMLICRQSFPRSSPSDVTTLLQSVSELNDQVVQKRKFGSHGAPWEFNLRDVLRWLQLTTSQGQLLSAGTARDFSDLIVTQRFRTQEDRSAAATLFERVSASSQPVRSLFHNLSPRSYQVGLGVLPRDVTAQPVPLPLSSISSEHLPIVESLMICLQQRWPCLLVGPSGAGKTHLIKHLAAVRGAELVEFALNPDMDTTDIVGGYEQVDPQRTIATDLARLKRVVRSEVIDRLPIDTVSLHLHLLFQELLMPDPSRATVRQVCEHLKFMAASEPESRWSAEYVSCQRLLSRATDVDKARFEWVDGALVKALEEGQWMVLDNANLCSPAVLDRLNSLLEPDGFLSINEHRTVNGDAKVVRPHANFRLFLTMDPRHGELSRAMRNRAVELYVPASETSRQSNLLKGGGPTLCESSMFRLRLLKALSPASPDRGISSDDIDATLSHLALPDLEAVARFQLEGATETFGLDSKIVSEIIPASARVKTCLAERDQLTLATQEWYSAITKISQFECAMQPIHPLVNDTLLTIPVANNEEVPSPHWIGFLLETAQGLPATFERLRMVETAALSKRPSQMTRLERSQALSRLPTRHKDSTAMIFPFVTGVARVLERWISAACTHLCDQQAMMNSRDMLNGSPRDTLRNVRRVYQEISHLWWSTCDVVDRETFDEGVLQMHLMIWKELAHKSEGSTVNWMQPLRQGISLQLEYVQPAWQLSTGLSMERLWSSFRSQKPITLKALHLRLRFEDLASRFDAIVWKSGVPMREMATMQESLQQAFRSLGPQADGNPVLMSSIEEAISKLEAAAEDSHAINPFFREEFAILDRIHTVTSWSQYLSNEDRPSHLDSFIRLLAQRSTHAATPANDATSVAILSALTNFATSDHERRQLPWVEHLTLNILQKSNRFGDVNLRQLDLLRLETTELGRVMATDGVRLRTSQRRCFSDCLIRLIEMILEAHADLCDHRRLIGIARIASSVSDVKTRVAQESRCWCDLQTTHHFRHAAEQYLLPSMHRATMAGLGHPDSMADVARAWVLFAIGALILYVPDQPFDPALRPLVQRELYYRQRVDGQKKLAALQRLETIFTGQTTNTRCRWIQDDLDTLGDAPAAPLVERPATSQLSRVQGDFTSLWNLLGDPDTEDSMLSRLVQNEISAEQSHLLRANLMRISQRLREGYRAYDDITLPVTGLLGCLDIGLALNSLAGDTDDSTVDLMMQVVNETPLLNASPAWFRTRDTKHNLESHVPRLDTRVHSLRCLAVIRSVQGMRGLTRGHQLELMDLFQGFYHEWKEQLGQDRERAAEKTGLYRYRGGVVEAEEDDEADMEALFPTSEAAAASMPLAEITECKLQLQSLAAELAERHADIFVRDLSKPDGLICLLTEAAGTIGRMAPSITEASLARRPDLYEQLLPAVILRLHDSNYQLRSASTDNPQYNFYTDANLLEVEKLMAVVQRVRERFTQLRDAWPEHATLSDVLKTGEEVLDFRHVEPLAKFLTKSEKLHGYIYEWQTVASREFSAAGVYDELTDLLVSWRRIELSTWARLFDLEDDKCKADARAWWFIAYELVIGIPFDGSGLNYEAHAVELLASLESFFATTSCGQFSERLRLLEQLRVHAAMTADHREGMMRITDALNNFVRFYRRYEDQVAEHIRKGRTALEKEMREVVTLASWKDTNINALRDSAKRSHHKLFKLVRKYRALLGQPVEGILQQGQPHKNPPTTDGNDGIRSAVRLIDAASYEEYSKVVPNWSDRPARLTQVGTTTRIMVQQSHLPESALDGARELENFTSHFVTSIKDLQKQTPQKATKDNQDTIKHLKSRKRYLFASVLRTIKQMGFRHNVAADVLATQASRALILAQTRPLGSDSLTGLIQAIDHHLHNLLELMPRVRHSVREHSEDLTKTEVTRSIGYLEALLAKTLQQREALAASLRQTDEMDLVLSWCRRLAALEVSSEVQDMLPLDKRDVRECWRVNSWLPSILQLACHLIKIHSELAGSDVTKLQQGLLEWHDKISKSAADWEDFGPTNRPVLDAKHDDVYTICSADRYVSTKALLHDFRHDLEDWTHRCPELAFILRHVQSWANELSVDSSAYQNGSLPIGLTDLDRTLSTTCDTILVALQQVQPSLPNLPTSVDEPQWLMQCDKTLDAYVKSLRMPELQTRILQAIDQFCGLINIEKGLVTSGATALFSLALPILQQYANICHEATERQAHLHQKMCAMAFSLAKSFTQLASDGFCSPSEASQTEPGNTEKLEDGTGLGDGEGAEDISKDIQDDEDLSELAQGQGQEREEDIPDEKDAVDIQDELEGDVGDVSIKGEDDEGSANGEKESGDEDMDEETGSVDDLDPTAVDEKLWDGKGDEAEKQQEGDKTEGKASNDEQVAASEDPKAEKSDGPEGGEEDEELDEMGVDEGEQVGKEEGEKTEAQAKDGDILDLPDDMMLDGDAKGDEEDADSDGIEQLSDMADVEDDEDAAAEGSGAEVEGEGQDLDETSAAGDEQNEEEEQDGTHEGIEQEDDEVMPDVPDESLLQTRTDDVAADADNAAPSDAQGLGNVQDESEVQKEQGQSGATSGDHETQNDAVPTQGAAAPDNSNGVMEDKTDQVGQSKDDSGPETSQRQAFRNLGDALEQWHRQQKQIHEPSSEGQEKAQEAKEVQDEAEFEHLQEEDDTGDTQALGAASAEQARAIDESMALNADDAHMLEENDEDQSVSGDDKDDGLEESRPMPDQPQEDKERRQGAMIGDPGRTRSKPDDVSDMLGHEEDMMDVEEQVSTIHLEPPSPADSRSLEEARTLWTQYESSTRMLSLTLTEQLRLILTPTLATKMRGDFRTGKRLNIKRIIPYIASGYRRDKIWMRRSVPSKRNYQIMLAVDDSKSMAENGAGELAFMTLTMVLRSLNMLELGQVAVVAFGEDTRVAHDFEDTFSPEAGANVFRHFSFSQTKTDVRRLLVRSLSLFREARLRPQAATSVGGDVLWQLQLIISDGLCEDHDRIRQLVREAAAERIMMVFVIVDQRGPTAGGASGTGGGSILDMTQAHFADDGQGGMDLTMRRYLDGFPFQYYLVVADVRELPGVLAAALRQWFAEVVDAGG